MGQLPPEGQPWAADNGCFSRPEDYTDEWYLGWLERMAPYRAACLFATAPDVWGDGPATVAKSTPVLARIRALGYPVALVAQTGLSAAMVPWDAIDVLFIGGPNAWQHSEALIELAREAKRRGKGLHMGRVNSLRRIRYADHIGCDTADGTFLRYGPDKNLDELKGWLTTLAREPSLNI
jgi:hypothetical protein